MKRSIPPRPPPGNTAALVIAPTRKALTNIRHNHEFFTLHIAQDFFGCRRMAKDIQWQDRIKREIEARRLAAKILGVDETASREEIKRAWRRECRRTHPDQNPDVPDAPMKFRVVNCAYRFLTDGTPCEELFGASKETGASPAERRYKLDNAWGMFLWWRDRFF